MKVIQAKYEILPELRPTKQIERAARVCYKSKDNAREGSDLAMVRNLVAREHFAMLEHASICVEVDEEIYEYVRDHMRSYEEFAFPGSENYKHYLRFTETMTDVLPGQLANTETVRYLISGNVRAWYNTLDYLEYVDGMVPILADTVIKMAGGKKGALGQWYHSSLDCYPIDNESYINVCNEDEHTVKQVITDFTSLTKEERLVHETLSVLFTVDRGISHELVRMRECSFAQESTRYCNYNNDKFGNDITVIQPCFWDKDSREYAKWYKSCALAEKYYMQLVTEFGVKPEEARSVLPTSTKTDIVVTANLQEWHHIFELRACDATGKAHPQMKEVMVPLLKELQESKKYKDIFSDLSLK